MTEKDRGDELLPDGVPAFDDSAYDDLRSLLADAKVSEPMPVEVADRLDAVLADLGAEKPETVVPLRRRSRAGQRLLVAATVVGVLGVGGIGLSQVISSQGGDDSGLSSASKAADDDAADAASGGQDQAESAPEAPGAVTVDSFDGSAAVPRLHSARFTADATRVLSADGVVLNRLKELSAPTSGLANGYGTSPTPSPSLTPGSDNTRASQATGCTPPLVVGATSYRILLDGKRATLVVHKAVDGKRLVQAWSCDAQKVLASATIDN